MYLSSEDEQRINFVTADAGLAKRPTHELCLLAGVAEVRYHLGIQTYAWENWQPCTAYELESESSLQNVSPRAIRYIERAMMAIDYDTGDQPLSYLAWRAEQHQQDDYLRQVWGAPTEERRDKLENVLRAVDACIWVLYAPYTSRSV